MELKQWMCWLFPQASTMSDLQPGPQGVPCTPQQISQQPQPRVRALQQAAHTPKVFQAKLAQNMAVLLTRVSHLPRLPLLLVPRSLRHCNITPCNGRVILWSKTTLLEPLKCRKQGQLVMKQVAQLRTYDKPSNLPHKLCMRHVTMSHCMTHSSCVDTSPENPCALPQAMLLCTTYDVCDHCACVGLSPLQYKD